MLFLLFSFVPFLFALALFRPQLLSMFSFFFLLFSCLLSRPTHHGLRRRTETEKENKKKWKLGLRHARNMDNATGRLCLSSGNSQECPSQLFNQDALQHVGLHVPHCKGIQDCRCQYVLVSPCLLAGKWSAITQRQSVVGASQLGLAFSELFTIGSPSVDSSILAPQRFPRCSSRQPSLAS